MSQTSDNLVFQRKPCDWWISLGVTKLKMTWKTDGSCNDTKHWGKEIQKCTKLGFHTSFWYILFLFFFFFFFTSQAKISFVSIYQSPKTEENYLNGFGLPKLVFFWDTFVIFSSIRYYMFCFRLLLFSDSKDFKWIFHNEFQKLSSEFCCLNIYVFIFLVWNLWCFMFHPMFLFFP